MREGLQRHCCYVHLWSQALLKPVELEPPQLLHSSVAPRRTRMGELAFLLFPFFLSSTTSLSIVTMTCLNVHSLYVALLCWPLAWWPGPCLSTNFLVAVYKYRILSVRWSRTPVWCAVTRATIRSLQWHHQLHQLRLCMHDRIFMFMRDAFRSKAWDLNQPVGKFWPNILANHRNILTMACQWSPATYAKFSSLKQWNPAITRLSVQPHFICHYW